MLKTFIGHFSSNTYIWCRHEACMLIDPSDHLQAIQETLAKYTLEYIVLTHAHADHMHLLDQFDVPIYLHEKDFVLLKNPKHIGYPHGFPYALNTLKILKIPNKIKLSDMTIDVIHTPGHSPGSICLHHKNILIAGDTLFKSSIGRTDLFLSSLNDIKKSVIELMNLPSSTKVYPGHGEKTTIRQEKSHNSFVIKWLK